MKGGDWWIFVGDTGAASNKCVGEILFVCVSWDGGGEVQDWKVVCFLFCFATRLLDGVRFLATRLSG